MRSDGLTQAQCRSLQAQLHPMLDYLNKLLHRMQNKGFPLDDLLWLLLSEAHARMQDRITELRCTAADATRRDTLLKDHHYSQPHRNGRCGD
jgi:hypothetical protein